MKFRLRNVITAAIMFLFVLSAATASGGLNVSTALSTISIPDLVSVAYDNVPDEEKMRTQWQGKATVEVYMLSDVVNTVGNVTGPALYDTVWQTLAILCPGRIGGNNNKKCYSIWKDFPIRYKMNNGKFGKNTNQIHVESSHFEGVEVRNLLFGALAGAYQAMSEMPGNCFYVDDEAYGYRYCNVAMKVGAYTSDSHIYITLRSDIEDDNDGTFHCCESREAVDAKLDELQSEFMSVYPTTYDKFRLVECHLGCTDNQREDKIDVDRILAELINVQQL